MVKDMNGQAPQPNNPEAGVIGVLLIIAFVVFLLSLPGLRDCFNLIANPFSAH